MFPAGWFAHLILDRLVSLEMASEPSITWTTIDSLLTVPIPLIITVVQYYLIGLTLDHLSHRKSNR
jgi:hypothetical protein